MHPFQREMLPPTHRVPHREGRSWVDLTSALTFHSFPPQRNEMSQEGLQWTRRTRRA